MVSTKKNNNKKLQMKAVHNNKVNSWMNQKAPFSASKYTQ